MTPGGRDPGLQPERTALARHRTGIAGLLVGTVATTAAATRGQRALLVAALLVLAAVGVCAVVLARAEAGRPGAARSGPWVPLLAAAAVPVLLALVGVALALQG